MFSLSLLFLILVFEGKTITIIKICDHVLFRFCRNVLLVISPSALEWQLVCQVRACYGIMSRMGIASTKHHCRIIAYLCLKIHGQPVLVGWVFLLGRQTKYHKACGRFSVRFVRPMLADFYVQQHNIRALSTRE